MTVTLNMDGSVRTISLPSVVGANTASLNKRPNLPASFFKFPVHARLKAVQEYISSFEYKQSPQTSFNSHKSRPLARIMDTAKMMVYNPQPIKCIEAVFLAIYLTAGISDVERIPLGFKSEVHGQVHQHIVLLVKHNGKYGAFGISRQQDLMNKDLDFESVTSIINDYKMAYEKSRHKVLRIRVGLPVEHNLESFNFICWRYLSLDPSSSSWEQCSEALERHASQAKRLWERWLLDGQRENRRADIFLKDIHVDANSKAANSLKENMSRHGEQEAGLKLIRRQALAEIRQSSLKNTSDQFLTCKQATKFTSKIKMPWSSPTKKSLKELHLSAKRCFCCQRMGDNPLVTKSSTLIHKSTSKKMVLKSYSLEFSGSCRRLAHADKKKQKILPCPRWKGRQYSVTENSRQTPLLGLPLSASAVMKHHAGC